MAFQVKKWNSIVASMINWVASATDKITDFNPGSVIRTLLEAVASEMEELYYQLLKAVEEAIEEAIYRTFNFPKNPAERSNGAVTFTRTTGYETTISIPLGSLISTDSSPPIYFETLGELNLPVVTGSAQDGSPTRLVDGSKDWLSLGVNEGSLVKNLRDGGEATVGGANITGTAQAGSSDIKLVDTTKDFVALGVTIGSLVKNLTAAGAYSYVSSISTTTNPNDSLNFSPLSGGAVFILGNSYEVVVPFYSTTYSLNDTLHFPALTGGASFSMNVGRVFFDDGISPVDYTTPAEYRDTSYFPVWLQVGQYIYIGFDFPTSQVNYYRSSAPQQTEVGILSGEYWTGSVWVNLTYFSDGTKGINTPFAENGVISWTLPEDWVRAIYQTFNLFWIRLKVDSPLGILRESGTATGGSATTLVDGTKDFLAAEVKTASSIGTISVGGGGAAYTVGDILTIVDGVAVGGTATVVGVSGGVVTVVSLTTYGDNYSLGVKATTGGTGLGCTISIDTLVGTTFCDKAINDTDGGSLPITYISPNTTLHFASGSTFGTSDNYRILALAQGDAILIQGDDYKVIVMNGNTSAQAIAGGVSGNVAANTIIRVRSSIPGLSFVTNPAAFSNGREEETDESRKARFAYYIQSLARATKSALEYAARTVTQVVAAKAIDDNRATVWKYDGVNLLYSDITTSMRNPADFAVELFPALAPLQTVLYFGGLEPFDYINLHFVSQSTPEPLTVPWVRGTDYEWEYWDGTDPAPSWQPLPANLLDGTDTGGAAPFTRNGTVSWAFGPLNNWVAADGLTIGADPDMPLRMWIRFRIISSGTMFTIRPTGDYCSLPPGIGYVYLYCHDGSGSLPTSVRLAVESAVELYRGCGITVLVLAPNLLQPSINVKIWVAANYDMTEMATKVKQSLIDWLSTFVLSQDLYMAEIYHKVMGFDEKAILNCEVIAPTSDIIVPGNSVIRANTTLITVNAFAG